MPIDCFGVLLLEPKYLELLYCFPDGVIYLLYTVRKHCPVTRTRVPVLPHFPMSSLIQCACGRTVTYNALRGTLIWILSRSCGSGRPLSLLRSCAKSSCKKTMIRN
jgi:hypothetical protein